MAGGPQLAGRTVTIKVRYADFTRLRAATLSRPTADADVISSWATELLHRTQAGVGPVRHSARVSNLVEQAGLNLESSGAMSAGDSLAARFTAGLTG